MARTRILAGGGGGGEVFGWCNGHMLYYIIFCRKNI